MLFAVVLLAALELATVPTDGTVELVSAVAGEAVVVAAVAASGEAVAAVDASGVAVAAVEASGVAEVAVELVVVVAGVAAGVAAVVEVLAVGDVVGYETCWCVTVVSAYTSCTLVSATMAVY